MYHTFHKYFCISTLLKVRANPTRKGAALSEPLHGKDRAEPPERGNALPGAMAGNQCNLTQHGETHQVNYVFWAWKSAGKQTALVHHLTRSLTGARGQIMALDGCDISWYRGR